MVVRDEYLQPGTWAGGDHHSRLACPRFKSEGNPCLNARSPIGRRADVAGSAREANAFGDGDETQAAFGTGFIHHESAAAILNHNLNTMFHPADNDQGPVRARVFRDVAK